MAWEDPYRDTDPWDKADKEVSLSLEGGFIDPDRDWCDPIGRLQRDPDLVNEERSGPIKKNRLSEQA